MFITLTIDTNHKKRKTFRVTSTKFNPAIGWRKAVHSKKRSLWTKMTTWKKSIKDGQYKLDGQTAML